MTQRHQALRYWVLATGVALTAIPLEVAAQAAPNVTESGTDAAQGDIVVTANRRAETLQTVPSAISALSQAQIEARGVDSFEGFARSLPGLTMNQATKNRAVFNIRGLATNVGGANTQDPVSVYINDTPVTDTFGTIVQPDLRLFDVERIEVLRGPQGTLFGSGSLGGTIRIITNKPDVTKFQAEGRVDLGTTEHGGMRQRYDAMINVPLVDDKLALRVVGYYRNEKGWVENVTLGTRNDTIDWGGRASLIWLPTDNLTIKAEVFHQNSDPKDGDGWNPALGEFRKASVIPEGRPLNLTNYNLSLDYDVGEFATLTSTSTYQQSKTASFADLGALLGPGTPEFLSLTTPWNSRFLVQEMRLVSRASSRLQWVAGLFYINRKTSIPDYLITAPGLNALLGGTIGNDNYFRSNITTKSSEVAGYADGTYELLDGLKLHGGVRVFHTTADYIEKNRVALNFGTLKYDPPLSFANHGEGTNSTWRVGVSFEPRSGLLAYANVSKGFRVGQTNANFGKSPVNPNDYVIPEGYDPDTTINYEVGAKSTFLNGHVTLNASGFYIDWKNIQIDGTRISDHRSFIANAGRATVKGIEVELTAGPARGINLYTTVTVQDGQIDSVPTNIVIPASEGDRLPGLARWKLSGGIEYRRHVSDNTEVFIRADGQFTDGSPNGFVNGGLNKLYAYNSEYTTVDASVGVDTSWGTVALYGENLNDNHSFIIRDISGPNGFVTLRPRTIGIRVTHRR